MALTSQPAGESKSLVILFIEDNANDAELALLELSSAGFEVSADVVDTLADVASHLAAKTYDVVLADYNLRGWVGPDALPIARQRQADIPFILISGTVGEDVAVEHIKNGVTDFVLKNQLARLPLAIRRALRERALSEQRTRALNEMAESEERFRNLVEASPDAIFVHLEGKIVFANPATLRLLGARTLEEIAKKDILEIVHPDDLAKIKKQITIDFERGVASPPMECAFLRMDGSSVAVEGLGIPIIWEGSRAIEVVARDITERKKAEQTAREWQQRLELAEQAALPIGLWEWDLSTDARVWSGQVYRQLGYTKDNFRGTGKEFLDRVHPEDRPRVANAVQAVASGLSQAYEAQFRVIRPDGTTCWVDSRGVMVRDGSRRMIGIVIDITKLRRSEEEYRSIIETSPYGIVRSKDGRFVMVNPAMVRMLGYDSESELLALDLARDVFCNPEDRAQMVRQLIETGAVKDAEYDWKRKDGRAITVRTSTVLIRNADGGIEGISGFVQDVTESKTLAKQFWQAQKMEAIGRLAGGIAHDFNNVLMVVSSYADLILQRQVADEKVAHYASQIHQAAIRAASVPRQLLAFSRQQVLEPEVLDLNMVIAELGRVLPNLLGEDIAVVTALEPVLGRVKVDRGQMEQIIMNLAVNARDAMPKGGRFKIRTQNVDLDSRDAAAHPPIVPGTYVKLSVADTGMGMDAETQSHVFEPFFTTKERGKGTGLGLATVYGIVKQSGGFISLTSEVGRGATFDVYLPRVEEPITRASKPSPATASSGGSEAILLVEDEEALRDAACQFLQSRGYTVLAAGNGKEAMGVCEQHTGKIDVILTDLVMPDIDGIEVAKAVATRYPDIRVIYMSGYTDRFVEGLNTGVVLLQKPFTFSLLASKLRTVLDSRKSKIN
ncbi:MAG: PAS domain S-box protein [Candidatus Korobacteraceae bacterium]